MQVQVEIGFDQLLKIVRALPVARLAQLKAAIDQETRRNHATDLETLLLNGPTATPEPLEIIDQNRKAINQWRTK